MTPYVKDRDVEEERKTETQRDVLEEAHIPPIPCSTDDPLATTSEWRPLSREFWGCATICWEDCW